MCIYIPTHICIYIYIHMYVCTCVCDTVLTAPFVQDMMSSSSQQPRRIIWEPDTVHVARIVGLTSTPQMPFKIPYMGGSVNWGCPYMRDPVVLGPYQVSLIFANSHSIIGMQTEGPSLKDGVAAIRGGFSKTSCSCMVHT